MASAVSAGRPGAGAFRPEETTKKETSTFHASLWGDFFRTYEPPTLPQKAQMEERAGVLKEEVRKIIKATSGSPQIMDLVITLRRLSLEQHYEAEIKEMLDVVYSSKYDSSNLNEVSRRFYLLRSSGYNVPSDVFLNFKDKEGNFVDADTESLLSLYNASYLRIHGETLLDEAMSYTRKCLEARLEHLESPLLEEVSFALDTPLFRKVGILETVHYIPIYEKEARQNEAILEFAKLNFNLLQLLYCDELKEITLWWLKETSINSSLSFVRDRIVEMYFWMNGAVPEPQYSRTRIMLSKMIAFITIVDDCVDSYGTTEESKQLAEAIFRWDECAISLVPEYARGLYSCLLKAFHSFEEELGAEKSYRVFYLKEMFKQLVKGYIRELTWRDQNYVPKALSEHLELSTRTIGASTLACGALVGMDKIVTKEALDWFLTYPPLVQSYDRLIRLLDDIASTEREQAANHSVSTVQCYMMEHGTTMAEANQKIRELTEELWKDMLQYYITVRRTEPTKIMSLVLIEFARTGAYMYQNGIDKFTSSHSVKDAIKSLYVEPIPM